MNRSLTMPSVLTSRELLKWSKKAKAMDAGGDASTAFADDPCIEDTVGLSSQVANQGCEALCILGGE